jgi:hypothetical protein
MQCTEISSGTWIDLMGDAFVASRGTSGPGLAEAMAEKLNLSSEAATGLAKGIEHLGHYAMSEATDEQSAVELEAEAVDVARRSVRGLYQAKGTAAPGPVGRANTRADDLSSLRTTG